MSRRPTERRPIDPVRRAAVEWHVRLMSDDVDEAAWRSFEHWLDAAPEHGEAYDQVERLWAEMEPPAGAGAVARPARRGTHPRWLAPASLAASLALATVVGVTLWRPAAAPTAVTYATSRGASRSIVLADGSRIRLNSASRLRVSLGPRERRAELIDGEAMFDVTHDPARPFRVAAGDRQVRVVGTEFDVMRSAGRLSVAVRRGVVEVQPAGDGSAPIARLAAGQSLKHREGATDDLVAADPANRAFAWTEGRLVYDDAPLTEVAADLNRYLPTPVVVDPEAAHLRLTAVMKLDSEEAMLGRLAAFLPVHAVREAGRYRIGLRPKTH